MAIVENGIRKYLSGINGQVFRINGNIQNQI
jgi:hypothetical protein